MIDVPEGAYCSKCGYCLAGLAEPRCPECGRRFDPTNSRTIKDSPYVPPRWPWVLAWLAIGYPALPFVILAATYFVAWIYLGHAPRPSVDDPKSINEAVSTLRTITVLLLSKTVGAILLSIVATICVATQSRRGERLRRAALCFAMSSMAWYAWFIAVKSIPPSVSEWFFN